MHGKIWWEEKEKYLQEYMEHLTNAGQKCPN